MAKSRYSLVLNSARFWVSDSTLDILALTSSIFASSTVVSASTLASKAVFFFSIRAYNLSKST